MPERLQRFLTLRAAHCFRRLEAELEGMEAGKAYRYADPRWPDHRWGIGQNGSIAGIVYHVAAWKVMTLPIFDPAGAPLTREEFDTASSPDPADWLAVAAWLHQAGQAWQARLEALTESDFNGSRVWEGADLPLSSFIIEMIEHDVQHASQIAYLKQRMLLESSLP